MKISQIAFRFPLFALTLCFAALALAQSSETGLPPFGSFQGSNFDLVSLENGNLHIEIPIYTVHQRALPDLRYNFVYDIPGWQMDRTPVTPTTFQWIAAPQPHQLSGWHLLANEVRPWHVDHDVVTKSCTYVVQGVTYTKTYNVHTNYVLTDTHGTMHPFEVRHVDDATSGGCTDPTGNQNTGVALDGSGFTIAIGSNAYSTTIGTPNNYGPLNGNSFTTPGISETNTTDSNGNLVTTIWTYTDSNGKSQQIQVDYTTVSFKTNLCTLLATDGWPCTEGGMSPQLPQKLTLPTGRFYFFTWSADGNGDLLRLDLPTGGYIAYTYKTYTKFLGTTYSGGTDGLGRGIGSPSTHYRARRQVTSRTVRDGITANTWNYNGFTITDPLGNDEVHSFSPFGDPPNPPRYETQILYYQGSSSSASPTLLKTINKDYAFETSAVQSDAIDHGDINVRLLRTTTILEDGKTQSKIETDYEMFQQLADSSIGGFPVTRLNPIEKREFDWGSGAPGALLRRTDYAYLHTGNQNYLSRNIVRQVTTTTVYDGNNNQVAQTVSEYDNYSHPGQPMLASNAIQHDATYDTNFIYRGNLTAVSRWRNTDSAMLTSTNQYDDAGNLLSTIDPLGHKTSFDYTDSWGNAACTPSGQAKIFATTITNALNQSTTKRHNSCTGTLASITDPNLQPTTFSYDSMGRLTSTQFPDGGQKNNSYDDTQLIVTSNRLISSTPTVTYVFSRQHYDKLGRIVQTELCEDGTSSCSTSIKTDSAYDELGRLATKSNPYRTATDPGPTNGTTTFNYDPLNRTIKVIPPDGSTSANNVRTDYSLNCSTVTDQAGKAHKSCSDALGHRTQVFEDPVSSNYETDYSYDTLDNLTSVAQKGGTTDPTQWRSRGFVYNSLSQLLSASNPESGKISYSYDDAGNVHTKTSPAQNQTITTGTSGTGWVSIGGQQNCRQGCDYGTVSITVNGITVSTNYGDTSTATTIATSLASRINTNQSFPVSATSSGNVVNLASRATGLASNYSLSATSQSSVLPDPFFTASTSGSTLTGGTDPPSVTLSYCYDALNRVTGKAYSAQTCTNGQLPAGTAAVSYAYDAGTNGIGRLTSLTDQAGSGSYTYDTMGRTASESRTINPGGSLGAVSKRVSYAYNLDGSVKTLTYPSGAVITYSPDAAGRDVSVIDNGNLINYVTTATYGPGGWLTGFVSGNTGSFAGITNSFSFNKRLQPVSMSASSPSGTVFSIGYDFHLDAGDNGNVYALTNNKDHTRDQTFTYDTLNRLTSAQNAGTDCTITLPDTNSKFWGNSYSYDAWGNLLTKNITKCGSEFLSVVAQANNQLVGFGYDAAGNMTSAPIPTGGQATSIFDAENRLTTASLGGATTTYTYDGDGNRVEKSNGSTGTLYWYMSPGVVAESDLAGNLQSEYVFFVGERIARKDYPSNAVSYYFSDHLKTTAIVTDAQGTILNESDYYPWGGELQFLANDSNHYKFTGKERDNETGLDYFGARYYSNQLARFITPDPLMASAHVSDPQSWNRYTYARNNPLRFIDPTGMKEETAEDCAKDKNCVTVKVNVIYDQKANDGKGVTDKQKEAFQKQLQEAKDEYGNAHIHLDVTYGTTVDKGAENVIVSDTTPTGATAVSQFTTEGLALTQLDVVHGGKEDFAHELAHHFAGDTTGIMNAISRNDPTGIFGMVANTVADIVNDTARAGLGMRENTFGMGAGRDMRPADMLTRGEGFNRGARQFQQMLNDQQAIRPQQK